MSDTKIHHARYALDPVCSHSTKDQVPAGLYAKLDATKSPSQPRGGDRVVPVGDVYHQFGSAGMIRYRITFNLSHGLSSRWTPKPAEVNAPSSDRVIKATPANLDAYSGQLIYFSSLACDGHPRYTAPVIRPGLSPQQMTLAEA
nr:hypothetical protein CFP56_02769 [Quercus suber]